MSVTPSADAALNPPTNPPFGPPPIPSSSAPAADPKAAIRHAMLFGPIVATMLRLAVPTVVVLFAQTLVGVAETYYVSFLGTDALAGVSLVFPISMLMVMMSNGGIGGGVASSVARAIGANRQEDADALVLHTLILACVFGLIFTVGVLAFGPGLYRGLGGSRGALDAALAYSLWVFVGSIPVWIVNLLSAALRGAGNVKVPAIVILAGAAVLIPLSPAFIFGFGPIPAFGIAGAGITVTAYYTVAAVVMMRYLASGRGGLTLKKGPLQARLFSDILRVGLMSSLSATQPNLTVIVITGAVGLFGINALAGYGMASRLDYLMIPLLFGLGTAVLTMVGTNIGAGNLARAKRIAWTGAAIGFGCAELIGLFFALFPNAWLHLFTQDPEVVEIGTLYLHRLGPVYGALGIGMLLGFAAQGSGRMLSALLIGTLRMVVAAGIGWVAVTQFGANLNSLFWIVGLGLFAYGVAFVLVVRAGGIWRKTPG